MISCITTWEGRQPKCTCYVLIKRTRTTGLSPPLCFYAHIKCTVERGPSNYAPRLPVLIWYRYLAEGARSDRVKEEDPTHDLVTFNALPPRPIDYKGGGTILFVIVMRSCIMDGGRSNPSREG